MILNGVQAFGMSQFGIFSNFGNTDRKLVIIQLNGGNDGLNMVIPLDQYSNLFKAREDIILDENQAIKIEDTVGFHPMLTGFESLYKDGELSLIQAVGYPNQNRSHFRSKDIWMTASPSDEVYLTGWMGRYQETVHPMFPDGYPNTSNPDPIAIAIGSSSSKTCQGTVANFSLAVDNPSNASIIPSGLENPDLQGVYGDRLSYLHDTYRQTNEYGSILEEAFDRGSDQSQNYTDIATNRLSEQLNIVGQLIEGGLQTSVYIVQLGGFDTHGDQSENGDPTSGRHPILLDQLSKAVHGFQNHLKAVQKDREVLGVTFSEFGRRIRANGSFGTDHGSAAPLFVFGSCVEGGIIGENPTIGEDVEPQEGVAMQHDFRSVYATIFRDWFEVEEPVIQQVLHDDVQYLPIVEGCISTSDRDFQYDEIGLKVLPSPANDRILIEFPAFEHEVGLSIFDGLGHQVKSLRMQKYAPGLHNRYVDVSQFRSGAYFVRWESGSQAKTVRFIKM